MSMTKDIISCHEKAIERLLIVSKSGREGNFLSSIYLLLFFYDIRETLNTEEGNVESSLHLQDKYSDLLNIL